LLLSVFTLKKIAFGEFINLELLGTLEEADIRAIGNRPRQYYNAQNVMEGLCYGNE